MKLLLRSLLGFSLLITSCGDNENKPAPKPTEKFYSNAYIRSLVEENKLVVTDENNIPLADANVLIGYELNNPFPNNLLKTDSMGILEIPKEWTTPLPVTIDLQGYLRVTYLDQTAGGVYFRLKKKHSFPQYEIFGETLGHEIRNYDDQLDFGLVIESMTKEDLLTFDINKIISPLSDVISVIGFDLTIPGNLSLPQQKESYVLPLTLSKPHYRIKTAELGKKRIVGLRGRFPFKAMVDAIREEGKNYADMINLFNLQGGTLQEVNVTQARNQFNLNTKQMSFTAQAQIVAPTIKDQEVFLAIGAAEDKGTWVPTDIKKLESNKTQRLNFIPKSSSYLIGVIKNKNEFNAADGNASRLSAVIAPLKPNLQFSLLPLIENPKAVSNSEFKVLRPNNSNTAINETGTYAVISATNTLRSDIGETQTVLAREWEIYASKWVENIKLPIVPFKETRTSRRFEIAFIGSTNTRTAEFGSAMIEKATHVTRSAIDY